MQAFQAVAEAGGFSEAARRLGLATSVVSKRIKDLEAYLGTQLFVRTTRQVTLTEAGQDYLDHVRRILGDLEEVESGLRYQAQKPAGTIRLTAPLSFGLKTLAPAFHSYLARYPDVTIKTHLSDRRVDLAGEGYDLAIRIGALEGQDLVAKKLCHARRVVCATPDYFARHGRPQHPADLKGHNCLGYLNQAEGKSWPFMIGGKKIRQGISGNFASDNGDLLHQMALAGCGIALLPTFIAADSLNSGALDVALEPFEEIDFDIYAVYQHTRHLSVKIRTLIDHLSVTLTGSFDLPAT